MPYCSITDETEIIWEAGECRVELRFVEPTWTISVFRHGTKVEEVEFPEPLDGVGNSPIKTVAETLFRHYGPEAN